MDPLDGPTGVAIAKLAESKGVTLISYDRAIFQGTKTYYVSFDNEQVGELIGTGLQCTASRPGRSPSPRSYVLNGGEDTDPNAISFATGYNKVVWGQPAKTVAAGATNSAGVHAGWRELRPRLGQHQGRHDLPAGVHRSTRRSTPRSRPMTGSPTR